METISRFFQENEVLGDILKLILSAVVAIIIVTVVFRLEKKLSKKLSEHRNNINLRFVESIFRFVVILLAVQWVIMSSPLTKSFGSVLFQGTTVLAAIAGFAAQPVISDLICGLMLSATKPFELGDRIELENGDAGIVKDITMRHVVLQGIDTLKIIVPNSKLNAMKITNLSHHTTTRSIHFRFNVSYDTDVQRAMTVIRNAVEESPVSVPGKEGPSGPEYGPVYFIEYAASSLVLATTVYYEPTNPTEVVKNDINIRVKRALDEHGIEIPYSYINVVLPQDRSK